MKQILLLRRCFFGGAFHGPEEGVVACDDAEADRLIKAGLAQDVSEDFADPDADSVPPVDPASANVPPVDLGNVEPPPPAPAGKAK